MPKKVLLIGYGSIGKKHARNLMSLGVSPSILTRHPDGLKVDFSKRIQDFRDGNFTHCIISSPTARHLDDLQRCAKNLRGIKRMLIEKPLERSYDNGKKIKELSKKYSLDIYIAYNLRFVDAFGRISRFIKENKKDIKIVEIVAGQDLKEWRPGRKINTSYSAFRKNGGGVDLDLSHDIDYALWLFGTKFKKRFIYRNKISSLKIKSPDICKLILDYGRFFVDITLDYIRTPKERYIKIICENKKTLYYDFVKGALTIQGKTLLSRPDINNSYKKMLGVFLGANKKDKKRLCSLKEGLDVLEVLGV